METSVIIDLHQQDFRVFYLLLDDDFDTVAAMWEDEDPRLLDLPPGTILDGIRRWIDVPPYRYRQLVTQACQRIQEVADGDLHDDHPLLERLRFFVAALVLQTRRLLDTHVDAIRVQAIDATKTDFHLTLTETVSLEPAEPVADPGLRLVVDNTK